MEHYLYCQYIITSREGVCDEPAIAEVEVPINNRADWPGTVQMRARVPLCQKHWKLVQLARECGKK